MTKDSYQKPCDLFGLKLARQNYFIDLSEMKNLVKTKRVFMIYAWQANPQHTPGSNEWLYPPYCYVPWIHCNGTKFTKIDIKKIVHGKQSMDESNLMFPMNKFFKNIDELADWMGEYYGVVLADII